MNLSGNTEFIYNSALYGGGVYSYSSSNIEISGNNTFIGNSVQDGGGVYSNSNMTIGENTTFIDNSASRNGGGVYAGFHSNINFSGNAIFISNIARGDDTNWFLDSVGCGGGHIAIQISVVTLLSLRSQLERMVEESF